MRLYNLFEAAPPETLLPGEGIKIQEILEPGGITDQEAQDLEDLFERMETECSEFLEQAHIAQKWLYRGVSDKSPRIFRGRSRHDRKPLHSLSRYNDIFDDMLKQLGLTALRSNSIFCTGEDCIAKSFGTPYLIFPINGRSTYTWTLGADLILDRVDSLKATDQHKWQEWCVKWKQAVENCNLTSSKKEFLTKLPQNFDAIAFATRYIAENRKALLGAGMPEQLLDVDVTDFLRLDVFKRNWAPRNTDMSRAMMNNREILVNGEYYAFSQRDYQGLIQAHWGIR